MAMNRAQFKKQLQEGLNAIFGLEYKGIAEPWRKYLTVETESNKAYVEDVMMSGFGVASVKAEGQAVNYDSASEVYTARYLFETIALAFAITEEAEEDNLYGSLGRKLSRAQARSMKQTKAIKCANVLNNGFDNTDYKGGDGVCLFSTAHPGFGGASRSNTLATPADFSETSLEDLCIQIANAEDYRGLPMPLTEKCVVVAPANKFVAQRTLYSDLQSGSAENDLNAMKDLGMFPGGICVDRNLTDTDAWFVITDCPDGLKHIVRKTISSKVEGDFESGNMRFRSRERYINGWSDPFGAFGSAGAG